MELKKIEAYVNSKGLVPLPANIATKMFEQYLNGSSLNDICKMFSEHDSGAIYFTCYHYDWPIARDELTLDIQDRIKQKILFSKHKQLELVDGMISVAHQEAMHAFQAYLKHPCDKNIPKTFRIKSIKDLQVAIEMISKIVGQDNIKKVEMIKSKDSEESTPSHNSELSGLSAKELISALNKGKQ